MTEKIEAEDVTTEMVTVGLGVLWDSGAIAHPIEGADRLLVTTIFLAMSEVKSKPIAGC